MVNVNVKWNKQVFENVSLDHLQTGKELKQKLSELSGVPPERQKIMGIGAGILKDDQDLSKIMSKVKEGQTVRMMGSAEKLPEAPKEQPTFVEDLSKDETDYESSTYPIGLVNMGNTCYMNASLECFRYIPELKQSLYNFNENQHDEYSTINESHRNLVKELKKLFKQLETYSDPKNFKNRKEAPDSIEPTQFLSTLRQAYPQFAEKEKNELGMELYCQQDADEFILNLLQSLENSLTRSQNLSQGEEQNLIKKLFEGEMQIKLQCSECDAEQEPPTYSTEKFKKLSCFISQHSNNLPLALQQSMEGTLEKESPTLGRTSTYSKTQRITKLPSYLVINMVRFYWRKQKNLKVKVLRDVKFPFQLDVYDLCTEDYQKTLKQTRDKWRAEKEKQMNQEREKTLNSDISNQNKKQKVDHEEKMSDENQEEQVPLTEVEDSGWFELFGIVTHKGRSSNSGHYVGWIKDENGRWLEYDDDDVTEVSEEEIKKLSGGGDYHIAYSLFYRKARPNTMP